MHANSKVYSQFDANLLALLGHDVLAGLPSFTAKLLHHRLLLVEPGALLLRAGQGEWPDLDLIVEAVLGCLFDRALELLVADVAPRAGLGRSGVSRLRESTSLVGARSRRCTQASLCGRSYFRVRMGWRAKKGTVDIRRGERRGSGCSSG